MLSHELVVHKKIPLIWIVTRNDAEFLHILSLCHATVLNGEMCFPPSV